MSMVEASDRGKANAGPDGQLGGGVIPVLPTPLTPDARLDEPALRRIAQRAVGAGADGLWVLGAGGEFPQFSRAFRRDVVRAVLEAVGDDVPVIAGVGSCGEQEAIQLARDAAAEGASAVHSVEPYYYTLRVAELLHYFLGLSEASPCPLVLYHHSDIWVRGGTRRDVLAAYHTLMSNGNIVAMKDATRDFRDFQRLVMLGEEMGFPVMTSAGRLFLASLVAGAAGGVFHEAIVVPELFVGMYRAARAGDLVTARRLQRLVFPLGDAMSECDHPSAKAALSWLGLCDDTMSPPLLPLGDEGRQRLFRCLEDLHVQAPEMAQRTSSGG
jgi:4-hydroxy-tetrahydrodipicolinate synthase